MENFPASRDYWYSCYERTTREIITLQYFVYFQLFLFTLYLEHRTLLSPRFFTYLVGMSVHAKAINLFHTHYITLAYLPVTMFMNSSSYYGALVLRSSHTVFTV